MSFWLRFAIRSCLRRRRRTGILLAGIAFPVAALVVLGAIMVGVNDTMVRNAVAVQSGQVAFSGRPVEMSAALARTERLAAQAGAIPGVRGALPRCRFQALAQSKNGTQSVVVWAVAPEEERRSTPTAHCMTEGTYLSEPGDTILGAVAAENLGVAPGDTFTLVTPTAQYTRTVSGVYAIGIPAADASVIYIGVQDAKALAESQVYPEVAVFLTDDAVLDKTRDVLAAQAQAEESVETWKELSPEVAQLVELNEFSMRIVILMVIVILGFGVSNALLISVMDRYRHFAVLKALGARPGEIASLIMLEAFAMCFAAGVAGTILGVGAAAAWGKIGLDLSRYTSYNPHFSVDPIVHPRVTMGMTLTPQILALCAGLVSALWPAAIAARRRVAGGMRDV